MFENDVVNYAVFFALLRIHNEIALDIALHLLQALASVFLEQLAGNLAHAQDFAGMDVDIGRLARKSRHQRLVNENARCR